MPTNRGMTWFDELLDLAAVMKPPDDMMLTLDGKDGVGMDKASGI